MSTKNEAQKGKKQKFKDEDFRIEQMQEERFDEIILLFEKFFAPREPLTLGLHLSKEEITEYMREAGKNEWIKYPTSTCAIFVPENKIVGGIFTKILTKKDQETFKDEDISQFTPGVQTLVKILNHVENLYSVFQHDKTVDKILEIAATTVDSKFSGHRLVYRMTEEIERIAKAKEVGCQVVTAQSTNKITQHIRTKMGFESKFRVEYEDIKIEGKNPLDLQAMNDNTGVNIFVKRLK